MSTDPVAIDVNVDAALVLKSLVGIDSYPLVLALMPNIFLAEDRERVRAVILPQLAEAGIVEGDRVHPLVESWLNYLYRPDVELAARVHDAESGAVLRVSLVRSGEDHVLAMRCDDHIVIQSVHQEGRRLTALTAAVAESIGSCVVPRFTPVRATVEEFETITATDPDEIRVNLHELGAERHAATVITRALCETTRRAEVVMYEHHDGGSTQTERALNVLDGPLGRIIVTPRTGMDGQAWSTVAPGDDATLAAGIGALVELLPNKTWFDTSRT